jgi:hypothetical protein
VILLIFIIIFLYFDVFCVKKRVFAPFFASKTLKNGEKPVILPNKPLKFATGIVLAALFRSAD